MGENKLVHDCEEGCGCGEDIKTMHVILNDGTEAEWEVLKAFELNGKEYIALAPDEGKDIFLYRLYEDDEGVKLDSIEDSEEYAEVGKTLNIILDLEHNHN